MTCYLSTLYLPEANDLLGIIVTCHQRAQTIKKKFNHRSLKLAMLPGIVLGSATLSVYAHAGSSTSTMNVNVSIEHSCSIEPSRLILDKSERQVIALENRISEAMGPNNRDKLLQLIQQLQVSLKGIESDQ